MFFNSNCHNDVVPLLMHPEGQMKIRSPLRAEFDAPYLSNLKSRSKRNQIEAWREIKKVRNPQAGDRWISMIHHGDMDVILFYDIISKSED